MPMIGNGTVTDPRRPLYAPLPGRTATAVQGGILTFSFVPSDDGKYALVEYVGRDSAALAPILNDKSLKVFVKGKDPKADIEKQFKQYKKDFDLEKFGTVLP